MDFRKKGHRPDARGVSNLGVLIIVLVIAAGVFVGSQVFPYYYGYWELQGHFEEMASKAKVNDDKHIREFLTHEIQRMGLPVEPKDLVIKRQGRTMLIDLEYTQYLTLTLPNGGEKDLWEFNFNPHAEEEF